MRFLDLTSDTSLPMLLEMLRGMSKAESSRQVINAFLAKFPRIRNVERFVGVEPVPFLPGGYRVLYTFSVPEFRAATSAGTALQNDCLDPLSPITCPPRSGGVIAQLIESEEPKLVANLDAVTDPDLAELLDGMTTCMAVPIFQNGKVCEWSLGFSRVKDGFGPEEVAHAQLNANMLNLASRHMDALEQIRSLNHRLREQLDRIAHVQQSLLPGRTPHVPGLEIASSYLSSDETGGDYYDFLRLGDRRWGVLIADVSGHGAGAATVMAMFHAMIHAFAHLHPGSRFDPGAALAFANDRLLEADIDSSFITALLGVIDPCTGVFRFANAGHWPAKIRRATGKVIDCAGPSGPPLGVIGPLEWATGEVTLEPEDALVLYTDGVSELMNAQREQFGPQRLDAAIASSDGDPDATLDAIHAALFRHRGTSTRDDDQTIVVIRFHGICEVSQ